MGSSRRRGGIGFDATGAQPDDAVAAACELEIMRDEDQGRATVALQGEQQVDDRVPRGLVEIAGRLVGDHDGRIGHKRAGDRHALLLATRELGGIMVQAAGEADGREFLFGAREGVRLVGEFEGQGDVLEGRHGGHEMKGLEDDADAAAAEARQLVLVQAGEVHILDDHLAGAGTLEARHGHEERRLPGSGGADEPDGFASDDIEADPLQDVNPRGAAPQAEIDILQPNGLVRHSLEPDVWRMTIAWIYGRRVALAASYGPFGRKRQPRLLHSIVLAMAAALMLLWPREPLAAPTGALRIVALGDSLTAGYGLPQDAAFPAVLERALKARGHRVEIINAGVSGDTAAGGLARVDWSVPDGTHGVILELGANDMLRGLDPAATRRSLEAIVTRLRARGIPVLLAGMHASRNLGPDYAQRFDAIYRDIAAGQGAMLYPFFLDGVAGQRQLNLPDGLHPTARGIETIVQRMLPTVEAFLTRLASSGS
jgi:acyl-CoA thioesterase I